MANKIVREIIHAKGIDIGIYTKDFENEYISLTDIAKYRNDNDPRFVIQNWMRNRNTVEFLAVWEELHNPDFNRVQFEAVRSEAGLNRFVMTPTKWIEQTNAIGIVSKAGRYGGGTYAHSDIAMAFATWISPEFQLYIMKDYRRLWIPYLMRKMRRSIRTIGNTLSMTCVFCQDRTGRRQRQIYQRNRDRQAMERSRHHILLSLQPACFNATLRMFHVHDLHLLMRRFQRSRGRELSRW